ncbi:MULTISPECIES: hypothetical protein [unclassified Tenacibaculum]|uniref:hypothetical protein n=1 Tax=unclassified Tenacibaculum TaxID=2635139 RepID=UPI001F2C9952|nr:MULTISPECIES: hypothetical protein [unclassified Tenacibaculum]MCF2875154.1 hypothetical protein [Tenacibaculum sp. Cn5-1]MCF2935230.1 hypothetical protein [Tenacibaculum sp. Cn5-34]MCG7511328.1 hypothetical protein [Tenacibaculum sp. Cn5-46]
MIFFKKLKAGALQYVLAISTIIALVLFAFISLVYLQQKLQTKNAFFKEAVLNVQFGFHSLANDELSYNQVKELQVSDNIQEKTSIVKKHWGVFDLATVSSNVKNEHFSKTAILGNHNLKREALYLKETYARLILVGNSKIVGNVSLPKQGISTGNIAGTSFNGDKLFYGTRKTSTKTLPEIANKEYFKNLLRLNFLNDNTSFFELSDGLQKHQSFTEETLVNTNNGHLFLSNIKLKGNIILHSSTKIIVSSSAILEDIILIAPEVEIKSNVKGNFQVFSSKKIHVNKNCHLAYPSALVLLNKQQQNTNSNNKDKVLIQIDANSSVKGVVLFEQESLKTSINFTPQIKISKNSIVTGDVYCNKNLELLGTVYGSVYTSSFITLQFGSTYTNHIYHGVINSDKLPKQYCGLSFKNPKLKVAKWVY